MSRIESFYVKMGWCFLVWGVFWLSVEIIGG